MSVFSVPFCYTFQDSLLWLIKLYFILIKNGFIKCKSFKSAVRNKHFEFFKEKISKENCILWAVRIFRKNIFYIFCLHRLTESQNRLIWKGPSNSRIIKFDSCLCTEPSPRVMSCTWEDCLNTPEICQAWCCFWLKKKEKIFLNFRNIDFQLFGKHFWVQHWASHFWKSFLSSLCSGWSNVCALQKK